MKKITSKEIAEALNISPSTVSRVLNNKGSISKETKNRIFDYIKNNQSDFFVLNNQEKRKIVGLVTGKITNEFIAKIIKELQVRLSSKNILLSICNSDFSFDVERQSILSLVQNKVDCIVMLATAHTTITREELKGIPIVCVDNVNPLIDDMPNYRIISDQYIGGVLAVEELIQRGCKSIVYLTNTISLSTDFKYKGYIDTHKKYNLSVDPDLFISSGSYSSNSIEDARNIINYLLAKGMKFDGIFATNDYRALGCLLALQEHNISVPNQVKIIGYDASTLAESFHITSIVQNIDALATNCFLSILNLIEADASYSINTLIPVSLSKGETT